MLVRQVFQWYADGVVVTAITARLNARGGQRHSYHAVRNWLANPRYVVAERETIHRKLERLVGAIEDGSATPALLEPRGSANWNWLTSTQN